MPKGYVIATVDVHDPVGYEDYRRLVPASLAAYGGTFVVRGGPHELLEGDWDPKRVVVVEFPSVEAAHAWYDSDTYAEAKAVRQRFSTGNLLVVEGA